MLVFPSHTSILASHETFWTLFCLPGMVFKVQEMQPRLEALEEAWSRLHTITGAETPEKLIAYWKGNSLELQY